MGKLRSRLPGHATVAAYFGLFVALATGGAYAANELGKDDVASKHIKNGGVKGKDLADNAVTSPKVANGSLLGEDFAAGQLPEGAQGPAGDKGDKGDRGDACLPSNPACIGPQGAPGAQAASAFAEFFALMPPDNISTVAPGAAVEFPQDGPSSVSAPSRLTPSSFLLSEVSTYRVAFIVPVGEAGQLLLQLNDVDLSYTVFGRAANNSQIVGEALITTTVPDSIIEVVNPAGNATALTITPLAGGTRPVAASLVIEQLD